jgi:NAD+ kinase
MHTGEPLPAPADNRHSQPPAAAKPKRIAVVVHPSRNIDRPLEAVRAWSEQHGVEVVQIPVPGQDRRVAEQGNAEQSDLVVAIGGDGTMLAAIRAGAEASRPVLGVASGSLGALASVTVTDVGAALDRFSTGDWKLRCLPALVATRRDGEEIYALNDIAVVRAGEGQVRTTAVIDGTLYARFAGDGCVVSTPIGSSGYALSAGGPLIAPNAHAFLLTPLPMHGGFCPPLVADAGSTLELDFTIGHGGARLEVDGQVSGIDIGPMKITLRDGVAATVGFGDQEPFIAGLRDRHIIADSPRFLAEDAQQPSNIKNP